MNKISKFGFTLIELLVVISIIGILSSLVLANFMGVRERGRDAARKADISQIQKALELYKNSQTPVTYPSSLSALAPNFIKALPRDPKPGWPDYSYTRDATDVLKYTLITCLENASDPQKDSSLASYCSGKPASFTRTEP